MIAQNLRFSELNSSLMACKTENEHVSPMMVDIDSDFAEGGVIFSRELFSYSNEFEACTLGCPILVKSLNLVPLIRVPIPIDILGRFLHFQSFRATFTIPQLTCKFCYILIIFALREDLICHFSITYCLRYQGDRLLSTAFLPTDTLSTQGHSIV